ncbi:MAG: ATP synthase subunit I [Vallitaleaceae bacterium]|jgi:hypothetical protein|nr:ATP synthase subunit I [Vallitaleaceae bacterium]
MSEDKKTLRQLMLGILIFVCPVLIFGTIIVSHKLSFIIGTLLGAGVSLGLLIHMKYTIGQSLNRPEKEAQKYMVVNYFVRYIITISFMVLAVLIDQIHIVGAILGLLSTKASAYIYPYLDRKNISNKEV